MAPQGIETDVLVIGGGGAGFRAAICAREEGASVTLVSKGPLARCGALARTESRGVHYREDYPDANNDAWLNESIVRRVDGGFEVTTRPVPVSTLTLPKGRNYRFPYPPGS